ncbi:MAG: T9SS type A sorting domain-containing protein [Flavobacteriales bacterium]
MKHLLLCSLLFTTLVASAQTWTKVGTGTDGKVSVLTPYSDGLAVGGKFKRINEFNRINTCLIRENSNGDYAYLSNYSDDFDQRSSTAKEQGTEVSAFAGFNHRLHVGGQFFNPGYLSEVGMGYFEIDTATDQTVFMGYAEQTTAGEQILCLKSFDEKLFIGGRFNHSVAYIQSDDYPNPMVMPAGTNLSGVVHSLEVFRDTLYAGGYFTVSDTDTVVQANIAWWNDGQWMALDSTLDSTIFTLLTFKDKLYAGGAFGRDSASLQRIAAWDGASWSAVGSGFNDSADVVYALAVYSDTLYAGGVLNKSGLLELNNLAQLDNGQWHPLGTGTNDTVFCMQAYRGRLYIGGVFQIANELICRNLVAYNNGKEKTGVIDPYSEAASLRLYPNPASDRVTASDAVSMQLMNMQGTIIRQSSGNSMDLNGLSKGHYVVSVVKTDGSSGFEQLLIVR